VQDHAYLHAGIQVLTTQVTIPFCGQGQSSKPAAGGKAAARWSAMAVSFWQRLRRKL
jgi:hypothetical protein